MDSLISESARQPSDAEAILWPGQLEQLHVTWTWSLPSHRIKQRLSEVRWWGILLKLFSTCEVTLRPQKTNQMSNKPRFSTTKQAISVQFCWHSGRGRLRARIQVFLPSLWSRLGYWIRLSFQDGLSQSHAGTAIVGRGHRAICSG